MSKLTILKRKAIVTPIATPATLNKIDCLKENVDRFCKNDRVIYESKIFGTR